jgi:hypothetical protein
VHFGVLVKTVKNFNYTISRVPESFEGREFPTFPLPACGPGSKMEKLLRRNERIHRGRPSASRRPRPVVRVPSTNLRPVLFQMVNPVPTLL